MFGLPLTALTIAMAITVFSPLGQLGPMADEAPAGTGLALWQDFLTKYVDTTAADHINRIRYASVTLADREGLESFLRFQQSEKVSALTRAEQKAFWINLYNADIIAVTLRHYPLKSIMDIKGEGTKGKGGPFDDKSLVVEGDTLSLNDIETRILRQGWRDNRIHFALNCASIGCPNLAAQAFTVDNIDRLMNKGAHAYLGVPRGATFEGPVLRLSSIFDWYREDFGGKSDAVVLGILANYADPKMKTRLQSYTGKIAYRYDWSLNDVSTR